MVEGEWDWLHQGYPSIEAWMAAQPQRYPWDEKWNEKMSPRQQAPNPMEGILKQLMTQAGPRGATFAGRVIPQGQTPNLKDLMTQLPLDVPEEGYGMAGMINPSVMKGMSLGMGTDKASLHDLLRRYFTSSAAMSREFENARRNNPR